MLAKTFSVMIIFSFISAILTDNLGRVTSEFASSLTDAVSLCISLLGMMCFWCGFMNVLRDAGVLKLLSEKLKPLIKLVYGNKGLEGDALNNLSASVAANFLGLGNAALPLGIKAVNSLEKNNKSKGIASDALIMFTVLNTVPFQLIPSTLITLRSKYGSQNPFDVVPAIWLCSLIITIFTVLLCKVLSKLWGGKGR